jgi:hypothetical protein
VGVALATKPQLEALDKVEAADGTDDEASKEWPDQGIRPSNQA